MGQEATKFLDLQQAIRRGPQNVVNNEISFQFCKTWDPSDVHDMLAMYTRVAKNDEDLSSLGHQLRQEALQDKIRRLKSLLSAIDDEDERFHATHPEGDQLSLEKVSPGDENTASDDTVSRGDHKLSRPKEKTKSTSKITPPPQSEKEKQNAFMKVAEEGYLTRRQEVSLDLERKERELQVLQNTPSMEDVDFSLPVVWNLYFDSIHKIDIESHSSAQTRGRKQWHPSTQGYSMERDPTAEKLLKDYYETSRAPTPAEANQINDGHTDDNASISDDEKLDSDTEVVDKDILTEGRSEEPPRTETLPLKGVIDTDTGLEKRTHTAIPPSYDPSIRSPVFFGYSTALTTKIETVNKETDLNQEEREEKYFEKLQAQRLHKLQEAMTSENGKLRALEERRDAQMEKRQKEQKLRTNELEEARKEGLDPSDDFFRKAEDARLKSVAQEAKEDETYQTQKDSIISRMSKAKEISEKEIKQVKDIRSPKNPVGALRRSFHVDKLSELHRSLDEAKADLDQALKIYDQTKNRNRVQVGQKESNVQQRAQLLFVEDQVKAAEKRVAFIIGQIEEDEFMLKRAEALIQLESTYYPSFDALSKCPNLLALALALVIMCSGTPKQKLKFIFNVFIQNDSSQDISTGLSRSAFLHLIQSSFRALDQLGQLHLPSRLTTDVPCTDESYLRDIVLQVMGKSPFLTWYNFKRFALDAIQRSKYLSTILRIRWKYEHISRFQQQNMTPLRQYECGIISASDLKYSMARVSVFSRSDLSLNNKELMHTRALAMGSNDPLKADYSRYLKLRRTKVLSNVVPLDHGCYKNLIVYRKEVAEKAAIRLQTTWRAKKGRQDATMAARKQAFYHAKGTALKEARQKVQQEWHALEAISQTTLDKMKFDAKIRMRQVKLRTKGLAFTRDEVLKVMIEEAVQDAFEEIDHRFREMEESAGYCPRMLRFDPLDTSHFSEIAKSLVAQVHAARLPTPSTAALLRSIAEKELKEKKEVPETVSVGVEPSETNVVPFVLNDMNKEKKKQSQIQNASMMKGLSRANTVLSPQERRLWFQLICSNPPKNDWSNRLFFVCDGMTELKLTELLLELPSKRHAVEYVNVFRNAVGVYDRDALITDLMEHFRIHRGVESLADALIAIARSDIETLWSGDVKQILSNEETFLEKNVQEYYKSISGRLIRELKRRGQDVDVKQKNDLEARQKVSAETKKRALEAIATWKMAEHSLAFTRRQIGARKAEIAVQSCDRTLWSERLKRALMADVGENTYTEVINVCQDFLEVAKHVATQIIREFHLPDHEKSLMPLPIKFDMDGRNNDNIRNDVGRGLRFEVHNIRFRVAVDDHGRFDGSDELAAKAASAECRNSSLFLPLMLLTPNVLVPLQCCIDYHGMRVLCSSKLPIERYDMSDRGSLQSQEKELIYGSENKGRTVVFHSKTLDSALARVNENLNLAAHCVRGSQDLTAKLINGAGDMQGYIGRDETFCLLKFRRMMPPEDPEETTHIEASTRGMSILWRQLRPALIKTNSAALSCDALSLFTHHTPDWEMQTDRVKNCTKRLLIEVIPCFARKMATRENYFTSSTFSLVHELHRHGINIRHLGLIRSLFYFQLDGTAALTYNSRIIGTTRDMTRELSRGDIVHIQGEDYTVSESLTDIFSDRAFTVDRCFMGDSCQNIQIHKGTIRSQFSIRETLLVEMIKRTVKNLVRSSLRTLLHSRQLAVGPSQRTLLVRMLNYVSGSVPGSDDFWQTQVFNGIRSRYGECAASYVDRLNLRRAPIEIIRYLASTTGFDLFHKCWHRFTLHPVSFLFTIDDMKADVICRVRHNLMVLHFSAASLLLGHASSIQGTTYQAGILEDSPCGYWPLNERRGSIVARNLGSSCDHGKFSPQCILEVLGPIANDDLRRAVGFPKATHGYITCSKAKKWDTAVSLEAWVCVDPSGRGIRAIVCHGRFTLAVLKNNLWGAWVNMNDIDVVVSGSPAIPDTWTHLVSTFDGTALQLYVNGVLYGDIDVQSEVNSQLERREANFQSMRKEIDDQEIKAKADCMKEVERECRSLYMTKEGKQIIKDISKKIVEDFEFKLRLKKRASQQAGLDVAQIKEGNQTKLSKSEIETLAKQQHMVQVYNQRIGSITALYQYQRNDLNSKIEQELADEKSQDGRPFRIGCVGNTSSNTKFFVGAICHVAFYSRCINRDIVTRHYVRGTLDRAWTSDALFELSAAQFTQALEFAPNDRAMLSSFAVNICSALKYDLDHVRSQEMYKSKVRRAVEAFRTTENYEGCAEILRNLPKDVRFSDLFRETYACLNELNPHYWSRTSNVSLLELDKLPAQFFMSGETKSSSMVNLLPEEIRTYADIIRHVIAEYPTNYGDGLTDLKWLLDLETDSAVVYFVLWLQAGEDSRRLDFTSVRDITEGDMDVITSSNRSCLAMRLDGCTKLSDKSVCMIALRCTGIEILDLSDIHHLTNECLKAISKTCSNLKAIYLTRCSLITDMGIEYLEKCQDVREIIINYCGKLTDDSLMSIATHMRLTRVEAAFCLQFSGFNSFCQVTISSALATLDLSGCRRLSDEALISIGTKFTRLTYLNLAYCDKITHRGIWAITHNCLELTYLNMEDMHLTTDIVFTFDEEGDGRESVAKVLLSKLSKIVLANCTKLTDTGIGYLLHRARTMTSIDISGCNLTDQGVKHLTTSIFNGSVIGEQIRELDLSYCMSLTSESLCYIRDRCKQLDSLYLTGCVLLQDVEMVGLIKSCSKISVLGLGFCRELTDNVLITIADCLWLEALYINRCSKFTDVGVSALASQCTGLQSLNLSGCKRLTDSSIENLYESCMKLIQLDVTFCPLVSKSVLSKFTTNRVRMDLRCDIDSNGNQDIDLPAAKTQEKLFRQQSKKFLISQNESPDK